MTGAISSAGSSRALLSGLGWIWCVQSEWMAHNSANQRVFVWYVHPEQWQELGAREPGGQGSPAPGHRNCNPAASHPPAGPCRSWRCEEKWWWWWVPNCFWPRRTYYQSAHSSVWDFLSVLCLILRILCRIQLVVSAQAYVLKFCYCFSNHLQMPGCEKALCFTALRCPGVSTYNNLD